MANDAEISTDSLFDYSTISLSLKARIEANDYDIFCG